MLRRLPRLCRVGAITALSRNELRVFQCFSNDTAKCLHKSASVTVFALVEPKRLFVQISEQMKRLNIHIRSVQRAFEQAPEVFQAIRVNVTLRITNGMVDNSSVVIMFKIIIRHKCVGADRRTLLNMLPNVAAKLRSARVINN